MARSSAPATPLELALIKGMRDDAETSAVDAQQPPIPSNPDPQNVLGRLLDHFGPETVLEENDWRLLLNASAFQALTTAEQNREISAIVRRMTYRASGHQYAFTRLGIPVKLAVDLLRTKQVQVAETTILATLLTITLAEALPTARDREFGGCVSDKVDVTNFKQCVELLGFPGDVLESAIGERKIISADGGYEHGGHLSFDGLRRWVESDSRVKPKWSGMLAATIARDRMVKAGAAADSAAAAEKLAAEVSAKAGNVLHAAFDKVELWQSAEFQAAVEERDAALKLYREILLRRNAPEERDVERLAEICVLLHCKYADDKDPAICKQPGCAHEKFDRARVIRDGETLDEAVRLEKLHATLGACREALIAAGRANAETKKRVERELNEARRQQSLAFSAQSEASDAKGKLAELRRDNPILFSECDW
jgi:hypothetical protein